MDKKSLFLRVNISNILLLNFESMYYLCIFNLNFGYSALIYFSHKVEQYNKASGRVNNNED